MENDQSDKAKFDELWEEKMKIAMANFKLMQEAGGSVYGYDPYKRYYLKNQHQQSTENTQEHESEPAEQTQENPPHTRED